MYLHVIGSAKFWRMICKKTTIMDIALKYVCWKTFGLYVHGDSYNETYGVRLGIRRCFASEKGLTREVDTFLLLQKDMCTMQFGILVPLKRDLREM